MGLPESAIKLLQQTEHKDISDYSKNQLKSGIDAKSKVLIYGNFQNILTEESQKPEKMSYATKWHQNSTQALKDVGNTNGYSQKLRYYISQENINHSHNEYFSASEDIILRNLSMAKEQH